MQKAISAVLICLFSLQGCGGGGGFAVREKTLVNSINIHKVHIDNHPNLLSKRALLFWNGLEFDEVIRTKSFKAGNKEYENPIHVEWQGNHYNIACSKSGSTFHGGIGIFDSNDHLIMHLETPRYTTGIVALQLTGQISFRSFLAICVKQQSTSKSSTLFILDENFVVVYKEYLGEVDWAGKGYEASVMYLHISDETRVYQYIVEE